MVSLSLSQAITPEYQPPNHQHTLSIFEAVGRQKNMLETPMLRYSPCQKYRTWSSLMQKAKDLVISFVEIAVA